MALDFSPAPARSPWRSDGSDNRDSRPRFVTFHSGYSWRHRSARIKRLLPSRAAWPLPRGRSRALGRGERHTSASGLRAVTVLRCLGRHWTRRSTVLDVRRQGGSVCPLRPRRVGTAPRGPDRVSRVIREKLANGSAGNSPSAHSGRAHGSPAHPRGRSGRRAVAVRRICTLDRAAAPRPWTHVYTLDSP
jgi:hypothetical protein